MDLNEVTGAWIGTAELWEDPLGDIAKTSECTMTVTADSVTYTWEYDGTPHEGVISLAESGSTFCDSWHQKDEVSTEPVPNPSSIATMQYTYADVWGWRINISYRAPTEQLVVQMTNIAPWGEEARAMRMTCDRV